MATRQTNSSRSSQKSKQVEPLKPAAKDPKTEMAAQSSSSSHKKPAVQLTYEQIAERAKSIWRDKGCPAGQDETNWHEAEKQLKQEAGIA